MDITPFGAAAIGAVAVLTTTIISNWFQGRAQERRFRAESEENTRRWERERIVKHEEYVRGVKTERLRQAQECHFLLSELLWENNQTASYIESKMNDESEVNAHYKKDILPRLHRVAVIIACIDPAMRGLVNELYGETNVRWGYLRSYVDKKTKQKDGDLEVRMVDYRTAVEAGVKLERVIKEMQSRLRLIDDSLG